MTNVITFGFALLTLASLMTRGKKIVNATFIALRYRCKILISLSERKKLPEQNSFRTETRSDEELKLVETRPSIITCAGELILSKRGQELLVLF